MIMGMTSNEFKAFLIQYNKKPSDVYGKTGISVATIYRFLAGKGCYQRTAVALQIYVETVKSEFEALSKEMSQVGSNASTREAN